VFYFDFNSSELSAEDRQALAYHARFMNQFPSVAVVLEGHADERGSREYNLALGERRAKAIERILSLAGVAPEQIQVISFGEERPVALGHDNEAWHLNRRVELLYSGY
jgi:peptidoglycan-associated lipoprotein